MKENILNIQTVHQCNCCTGNKTLHPLVSTIRLEESDLLQRTVKFDFYTILLIEGQTDKFLYGRKYYDYSNASMVFLTPGQSLCDANNILPLKGWLLAFHPDLLCCTSLGEHIGNYTFFFYHLNEALHMSLREKDKVTECLCNLQQELQHAIDRHSKILICRLVELLLDYCSRFYERQFITRNEANKVILSQTDILLEEYIAGDRLQHKIFPSTAYCAYQLHLSTHYFSDLLKLETGKTLSEYFLQKRLEASLKMLLDPLHTVNIVAEKLGFPNVSCFCRLFEQWTGISPDKYKTLN